MQNKNYITPAGFSKLQAEYKQLRRVERPEMVETVTWAASNGDRSENADYKYGKKRLREIDRRLRFLSKQLNNAEIVDPEKMESDQVRFGATVTVVDEDDIKKTYRIVGSDESDAELFKISWLSPIAKALLKKKVGDWVTVKLPSGEKELEIAEIKYCAID